MRTPDVPYQVGQWGRGHSGKDVSDGHVFVLPRPAGPSSKRRDQLIYYQFRADRERRTLRRTDEQVAKAVKVLAGLVAVRRNCIISLDGAVNSLNRELEARVRSLAGLKGYVPHGSALTCHLHQAWRSSPCGGLPERPLAPGFVAAAASQFVVGRSRQGPLRADVLGWCSLATHPAQRVDSVTLDKTWSLAENKRDRRCRARPCR